MSFLVSPGVEVNEIDLTNVIPSVSTSIGGYVGEFRWGPVGEAVTVSSEKELASYFGSPTEVYAKSFLTAASFLKYGNALKVSRAIRADANNAANWASTGSSNSIKIGNRNDYNATTDFGGAEFVAKYPGAIGSSLRIIVLDSVSFTEATTTTSAYTPYTNLFQRAPGTSESYENKFASDVANSGNDEIHIVIVDQNGEFTGTPGTVLETWESLSLKTDAKKPDGSSLYYKTVLNDNSSWVWVGEGLGAEYYFGADDSILDKSSYSANFKVSRKKNSTFTFAGSNAFLNIPTYGISLAAVTPSAKPYKFKVTNVGVTTTGTKSAVTTFNSSTNTFTLTIQPVGPEDNNSSYPTYAVIKTALDNLATVGSTGDNRLLVTVPSSLGIITEKSFIEGLVSGGSTDGFTFFPGSDPITAGEVNNKPYDFDFIDSQGSALEGVSAYDYATATGVFSDPELIDVNLLFTSAAEDTVGVAETAILQIATTRKDCVAFISAPLSVSDKTSDLARLTAVTAKFSGPAATRTSYAVWDSSPLYVYNKYADKYLYIPASGHIAGLCANTDNVAEPWFSPAGYNRGGLLGVTKVAFNPKQADRDTLYKLGVNPIVSFPGQGILLFGDKTAQAKPSAFDRINVRRLFITLEKAVATAAKYQLFELNDEFTRAMFRNMVEPFLREVKGRRGVTDFLVICDETNNTGEVIDTNRFVADIYIKPARSINFITLNFIATRTGVQFSEIVGQ